MYEELSKIFARPKPFEFYTASDLWTDEHTSAQMFQYHLNRDVDISSRNHGFIDRSVTWMISHFNIGPNSRVADFGCGPGLYTTRLARYGAQVTGIDFSPRSIAYAREQAACEDLDIQYHCLNYLDFESEQCFDFIIMIFLDFCVLAPAQRHKLLMNFCHLLAENGVILLDVSSLAGYAKRKEDATCERNSMNGFWSPDDYFCFQNTFTYPDDKVVLDKYSIIEKHGTRTIYNWFQYFDVDMLKREFNACGLKVNQMFADVAGSPYNAESCEFAVVANKK